MKGFEVLSFELTDIYITHGIFPEKWGQSFVTPLPKANLSSTKPEDWRLISQICITGKLQLYQYLEENKLLTENQN